MPLLCCKTLAFRGCRVQKDPAYLTPPYVGRVLPDPPAGRRVQKDPAYCSAKRQAGRRVQKDPAYFVSFVIRQAMARRSTRRAGGCLRSAAMNSRW